MESTQILRYSLIIPVYKNEKNLPALLEAIRDLVVRLSDMEVVFVIDGSPDVSWFLLHETLPTEPYRSQLILLSRNFGSSSAIRTGLEYARGEYHAIMAADLQEPPYLIERFFELLSRNEVDVVIGQRVGRKDPLPARFFSGLYWKLYCHFINPSIPSGGIDVFACTKKISDILVQIKEHNSSISLLLFWVGFRRAFVPYERQERQEGKSAWTFRKKFRFFLDTVFSFSDFPIFFVSYLGMAGIFLSILLGGWTFTARLLNKVPVEGYTTLLLVILFGFSALFLTQGIIGAYLWRCFENTKSRPVAIVEKIDVWNRSQEK